MQLDKRFKVLPFCCFGAEKCVKYIGHKGYFTNNIDFFKNIDFCIYGTLEEVYAEQADSFQMDNRKFFRYFIPECFVKPKEKQYRPYKDIEEFCNQGFQIVVMRHKQTKTEYHVLYNGYRLETNGMCVVILGSLPYTLKELFNEYKILDSDGIWKPFGVEE